MAALAALITLLPLRWDAVRGPLPTAPTADPSDDERLLEAGLRALREGNSPLAVTLLRASAGDGGRLGAEAWLGLGVAFGRMERWRAALDALERSAEELPDALDGWIRYLQARFLVAAGRTLEADALLAASDERTRSGPAGERIRALQLGLARSAGERGRTMEILRELIVRKEGNAAQHAVMLADLVEATDPREAATLRRRALELPGRAEARGEASRRLLADGDADAETALLAGKVLYALADWPEAARAFRRARELSTSDAAGTEARYHLGLSLYRWHRYREARGLLSKVATRPGPFRATAAFYHARAVGATTDRETGAAALIAVADRFPRSRWAPRALKLAAERLGGKECGGVEEIIGRLIRDYPTYWENAEALFQLGNCARKQGDHEGARRWYVQLGNGVYHPYEKAQGFYWAARMASAQGDSTAADAYLQRAAGRYPDTFYGALAAGQLGRQKAVTGAVSGWNASDRLIVPEWATPDVAAGLILLRVGLSEEGEVQLLSAVDAARYDREQHYVLWEASVSGRAFDAAARMGERLLAGYQWSQDDRRLRNLAYPLYYVDLIVPEARERGLDPFLVLALMKQESRYLSDARSYAGARGLMQLMPETAREWARRLRLPPVTAEDLYDPALNIRLGIPYLARLVKQFDGSIEKALAAYNAGAGRVRRWERGLEDTRPETFVESIGIQETRTFVRAILNYYYRYRYLWKQPPA